ncbi:MAG: ribosomal RNA small subunit methyltransferase A [Myxococcales bacterium]|nr:ribosomal RNA small subunit methyltransferase A [Myxococcales bacterium]
MDWEDPRKALARHGLQPKRQFSQNFLVSREAVERIAIAATSEERPVLEFGPGLGTLTRALLERAPKVTVVEPDPDMRRVLTEDFQDSRREILDGDATTFDIAAWANQESSRITVTGNLPYSVTGAILRNLMTHRDALGHAVIMVQKEVRDRLLAPPGTKEYGALTVFTAADFGVHSVTKVSRGSFHPVPKVDSAVVRLVPHERPLVRHPRAFTILVRAAFTARRKMLRKALRSAIDEGPFLDGLLDAAEIEGTRRGETLTVEDFDRLATLWVTSEAPQR